MIDLPMTVADVMRETGLARSSAYALMLRLEHEKHGRALRVRRSVFDRYLESVRQPPCISSSTHQVGWLDRIKPTLGKKEASRTPPAFAAWLVELARQACAMRGA